MEWLFDLMQMAVDKVHSSPHPTNKIAATLSGQDLNDHSFIISKTNFWPAPIAQHFGQDEQIGNSSGTIHAEIACILDAPCTKGASLFLTDPPCPNCAKNIAEAGIRAIYIDHKGFEKDFAQRRGDTFQMMSLPLFQACGIGVFEIHRKEKICKEILPAILSQHSNDPAEIEPKTIPFHDKVNSLKIHFKQEPFALLTASDKSDNEFFIFAASSTVCGLTDKNNIPEIGKYSPIQQPINRILMATKRHGVHFKIESLYSSRIPTAREMVNLIGAGFQSVYIGDKSQFRDPESLKALKQLEKVDILKFRYLFDE